MNDSLTLEGKGKKPKEETKEPEGGGRELGEYISVSTTLIYSNHSGGANSIYSLFLL